MQIVRVRCFKLAYHDLLTCWTRDHLPVPISPQKGLKGHSDESLGKAGPSHYLRIHQGGRAQHVTNAQYPFPTERTGGTDEGTLPPYRGSDRKPQL